MTQPSQSNRSIQIGGNVSGGMIVSGDNNTVTNQSSTVTGPAAAADDPNKRKLLILAANPQSTTRSRLDQEVRDISEGLQRSRQRASFEIAQRWAVRSRDFQRAMLEELPQIVHFSGHSQSKDQEEVGLSFENDLGQANPVPAAALASTFQLFTEEANIECVVLNGCYSSAQAKAIATHVPFVVGVPSAVDESAAIEFVVGFYDALGSGKSIEFAFKLGKISMAFNSAESGALPLLLKGG